MANDIKFKLNLKGLNELMKSAPVQSMLDGIGDQVADMAGDGFVTSSRAGNYIGFCNVYPDDAKAAGKNYRENTLLKALGSTGLPMRK
jgi:hypothetical protein